MEKSKDTYASLAHHNRRPHKGAAAKSKAAFVRRNISLLLTGFIGLALALSAFFAAQSWENRWKKSDFERLSAARAGLFNYSVEKHIERLVSLNSLYEKFHLIHKHDFAVNLEPMLDKATKSELYIWAPRVPKAERSQFENELIKSGLTKFQIPPDSSGDNAALLPPPDEYYPILCFGGKFGLEQGSDLLSSAILREAAEKARDRGQQVTIRSVVLSGDPKDSSWIAVFQPVYKPGLPDSSIKERRAAIAGYLIWGIQVSDLFESSIRDLSSGGIDIEVIDLAAPAGQQILYKHKSRNPGSSDIVPYGIISKPELTYISSIKLGDRELEVRCLPSNTYKATHQNYMSWVFLLGGMLVTTLLILFLWSEQNRSRIVERLVDERTEQLRESEEKYRTLMETADDAILVTDLEGKHLFSNNSYKTNLGYDADTDPNPDGFSIVHPEDVPVMKARMTELFEKGTLLSEYRVRHKDGHWICRYAKSTLIRDKEGKPEAILAIIRDITEQKMAEEELLKFKLAFERSGEAIFLTDVDGKIVYVNAAFEKMYGFTQPEALGQTPRILKSGALKEQDYKAFWDTLLSKQIVTGEIINKTKDGRFLQIENSANPVIDAAGNIIAFLAIQKDITERKKAEDRLRKEVERGNILLQLYGKAPQLTDKELYNFVLDQAVYLTDSAVGFFHLVSDDEKNIILTAWNGQALKNCTAQYETHYPIDLAGNWVDCIRLKQPVVYNDFANSPNKKGLPQGHTRINRFMSIPVTEDGKARIIFGVGNKIEEYDDHDVVHLQLVANELHKILKQRRFEQALQKERDQAKRHLDIAGVMIVSLDSAGRITLINKKGCEILGYEERELIGQNWFDISLPGEMVSEIKAVHARAMAGDLKTAEYHENPVLTRNGEQRIIHFHNTVLYDSSSNIVGTLSSGEDITARKSAEKALRDTNAELVRAQRVAHIGSWEDYLPTKELFWSEEMYNIMGFPHNVPVSLLEANSVFPPEELERFKIAVGAAIRGEAPYSQDYRIVRPDGSVRFIHDEGEVIRDESGQAIWMYGTTQDITERKIAENSLRQSEENFRNLFNNAEVGMFRTKFDGSEILAANEKFLEIFGLTADEMLGKPSVIHWADPQEREEMVRRLKAQGRVAGFECKMLNKRGEVRNCLTSLRSYPEPGILEGSIIDITDRKRAEEALQESERKFRQMAENIFDVIVMINLDGTITYVSPAVKNAFGYLPEELIGRMPMDITPESEIPELLGAFKETAAGANVISKSLHLIRKDGTLADIEINAVPVFSDGVVVGGQAIIRDITETKRLEELESRAQRLEAAGRIAGQVAHDFNNLLTPLTAYPGLIRDELPANHPIMSYIDDMENSAKKIAEINQQLLTLGRRGHYNQEILNLNSIVRHAARDMGQLPETLVCEMDLAEDLMNVRGGGAQIHRVLINLLVNARDAVRDKGRIIIKTQNYYADDVTVAYACVPRGEYVKITITDTGCGIPAEIIEKIFDPFFTTKTASRNRGSGLGLSVVDAVIKDHGGFIDLSTKEGMGTSFYLYFPITREAQTKTDFSKIRGGNETLLVVDDDELQRKITCTLLAKLGYKVCVAESGERALEVLSQAPQDLLILDMVMPPGIDGAETYRRALEIKPEQKAIIVSGYSESERVQQAQSLGAGGFVKKPITEEIIGAAVRKELDRPVKTPAECPT